MVDDVTGSSTARSSRTPARPSADDPTIGKLVADATRDISTLVSKEIALLKSELKVSVRAGGMAIALFALAGFLGLLAIIMVSIAIAFFIHMAGLDLAWCFLIVFGAYLLLAALLGLIGYRKVRKVKVPERTIAEVQEMRALKPGS